MKAYFIDSANQTVSQIDYDGDWRSIGKIIGCHTFTVVNANEHGDSVFIDDEGLFVPPDEQNFFWFDGYPQMLAGNGLVLGTDEEGESVEPKCSLEWLQNAIRFQQKETAPLFMPDMTVKVYSI